MTNEYTQNLRANAFSVAAIPSTIYAFVEGFIIKLW